MDVDTLVAKAYTNQRSGAQRLTPFYNPINHQDAIE